MTKICEDEMKWLDMCFVSFGKRYELQRALYGYYYCLCVSEYVYSDVKY